MTYEYPIQFSNMVVTGFSNNQSKIKGEKGFSGIVMSMNFTNNSIHINLDTNGTINFNGNRAEITVSSLDFNMLSIGY